MDEKSDCIGLAFRLSSNSLGVVPILVVSGELLSIVTPTTAPYFDPSSYSQGNVRLQRALDSALTITEEEIAAEVALQASSSTDPRDGGGSEAEQDSLMSAQLDRVRAAKLRLAEQVGLKHRTHIILTSHRRACSPVPAFLVSCHSLVGKSSAQTKTGMAPAFSWGCLTR